MNILSIAKSYLLINNDIITNDDLETVGPMRFQNILKFINESAPHTGTGEGEIRIEKVMIRYKMKRLIVSKIYRYFIREEYLHNVQQNNDIRIRNMDTSSSIRVHA